MHVPFCPSHCVYCSFPSAILHSGRRLDTYTEALASDVAAAGALIRKQQLTVQSLYMGGGTPTILTPAQMDTVLTAVDANIPMGHVLEKTIEAGRPDTISESMLKVLADRPDFSQSTDHAGSDPPFDFPFSFSHVSA